MAVRRGNQQPSLDAADEIRTSTTLLQRDLFTDASQCFPNPHACSHAVRLGGKGAVGDFAICVHEDSQLFGAFS